MQVVMKDATVLSYADAQWVEYRDGAAMLMKLSGDSYGGAYPVVVAVVALASVERIDVQQPAIFASGTQSLAEAV